ncbi:hypothetical protein BUALT_Bualt13G0109500 [Buddleja alternifolia]|uniref:Uncharacterized protein n=1 Tax=Buddleja alternifolia TaxID=168488 RepID=A0AAV6WN88_9LAMI|nr:hypothetical protein BUALT_Bualt13G0109500 [Buddleja alternifolia]
MEITSYYIFALAALLLINFQMPFPVTSLTTQATDQSALLALKSHITLDPSRVITRNWTNSSSVCSWIGVTCNSHHHRVAAVDISDMGLVGTIPPQLGNLSFLVSLDLRHNFFSGTLPEELSLLHRLKNITLGFNNFNGEIPPWFGFLPKLQTLSLINNSFTGSIPYSISNLSNLEVLNFSNNSLQGNIPKELGRLKSLKDLIIEFNHLSGSIPSAIFNLSRLKTFALTSNTLSGIIPNDMCRNLPFLKHIHLSKNQFSGQIPSNLSECSQLQILSLSDNYFSGQIPGEIRKLTSLQTLYLGGNNLNGVIPQHIGDLQNLVEFAIEKNQITGTVPLTIFNISSLQTLNLLSNKLTGNVPREIENLTVLRSLDLSDNNLAGLLPRGMGKLHQLEIIRLLHNSFTGSIPSEFFNISTLRILSLAENGLSGNLPTNFGHRLPVLEELYLYENYLGGSIPDGISNCSKLKNLELNSNNFIGFVPHFFGDLRLLERLIFFDNNLRTESSSSSSELSFITSLTNCRSLVGISIGDNLLDGIIPVSVGNLSTSFQIFVARNWSIPECLENVTSLRHLFLASNMLSSSIPSSLWRMKDLLLLNLSTNSLSGVLPPEIGNLVAAIGIDLSMNNLSKDIPSTIGNLQVLTNLSLAHNTLEGSIPASVGSMISLVTLELSYNNLSGSIPNSLERLQHLVYFNISFNVLKGEIPSGGPFRNFTAESFKGNEALCGSPRFHVSPCNTISMHISKKKRLSRALLALSVVVSIIVVIISFAFILSTYRRKDRFASGNGILEPNAPARISYYELLQATEQFSERNLLGTGGFGSVYKGIMSDGRVLAVKVFSLQLEGEFKSFDVECEVLRNLRHRNLTKVIGSCSNEDFKALILEYMPRGSLEKWLYSHNYCLDLMQRLNIMIDVASALEYLHYGYLSPIVHCDLKPSNVLLDEEMIAHVSDFGIAKLLSKGESISHTETLATLGYMAPGLLPRGIGKLHQLEELVLQGNNSTGSVPSDFFDSSTLRSLHLPAYRQSSDQFRDKFLLAVLLETSLCNHLRVMRPYVEVQEYGLEGLVSTRCDVYSYGIMLIETFTRKRPSDDLFGQDFSLRIWVERSLPNQRLSSFKSKPTLSPSSSPEEGHCHLLHCCHGRVHNSKQQSQGFKQVKFYIEDDKFSRVNDYEQGDVDSLSDQSLSKSDSVLENRKKITSLPRPASLNAFDIISFSHGFDLSGLFEEEEDGGSRFVSGEGEHYIKIGGNCKSCEILQ